MPLGYPFEAAPPLMTDGSISCRPVLLTQFDSEQFFRELSTVGDVLDFLEGRHTLCQWLECWQTRDMDLVAAFKAMSATWDEALTRGVGLNVHGLWAAYSASELRIERDRDNTPSIVVDQLIGVLHQCKDSSRMYLPPTAQPLYVPSDYADVAAELNRLRRLHRRRVGQMIEAKVKRCDETGRAGYFAVPLEGKTWMLFVVSRDHQDKRLEWLFDVATLIGKVKGARRVIGISTNTPAGGAPELDAIKIDMRDDVVASEPDHIRYSRLFGSDKKAWVQEFRGQQQAK